jgi:mono/diheme cytochrome c family protein
MASQFSVLTLPMVALGAILVVHVVHADIHAADSTTAVPPWAKAPLAAHARTNPYGGNADAVRAGHKLFARHCTESHGENGRGGRNAPPLDTVAVRRAAAGDLFWLLTNGSLRAGMPAWSNLPDARRWQIVAFLKAGEPP